MPTVRERLVELDRQVAELQDIVAELCDRATSDDEDDQPAMDLDGNPIPRSLPCNPHDGL